MVTGDSQEEVIIFRDKQNCIIIYISSSSGEAGAGDQPGGGAEEDGRGDRSLAQGGGDLARGLAGEQEGGNWESSRAGDTTFQGNSFQVILEAWRLFPQGGRHHPGFPEFLRSATSPPKGNQDGSPAILQASRQVFEVKGQSNSHTRWGSS